MPRFFAALAHLPAAHLAAASCLALGACSGDAPSALPATVPATQSVAPPVAAAGSGAVRFVVETIQPAGKDGGTEQQVVAIDARSGLRFAGPRNVRCTVDRLGDFDGDGIEDAFVSCGDGGNGAPPGFAVITLRDGHLVNAGFDEFHPWDLDLKTVDGRTEFVQTDADARRHLRFDGQRIVLASTEARLRALAEIRSPGDAFTADTKPRGLSYDLDGDGRQETIACRVWVRWGSLLCALPLPGGGQAQELAIGCHRVGVLAEKRNGVHKLVCDFDLRISFDGTRWVVEQ